MTESTPWSYPLVRDRRFLTGFTDDRGGFKPKPNSKQSYANPPDGWSGREQTLKAPNHCHGAVVKSPLGAQRTLHDPPKSTKIPSWIWLALHTPVSITQDPVQETPRRTCWQRRRGGERPEEKGDSPCLCRNPHSNKQAAWKGNQKKGTHNRNRNEREALT